MNVSAILSVSVMSLLLFAGCGNNYDPQNANSGENAQYDLGSFSGDLAASTNLTAGYKSLSDNVFQPKCAKCHRTGGMQPDVLNYDSLIKNKWVVPGNPAKSPLLQSIAAGRMPPGKPLADAEVQAIGEWIQSGAPNN